MMKRTIPRAICFFRVSLLLAAVPALLMLPSGSVFADDDSGDTGMKIYAQAGIEYNDNIFELSDSQITKLEDNASEDRLSGRFHDMDSVEDTIITPELGLEFSTTGAAGRALELSSQLQYHAYSDNTACSYPELRARLEKSLSDNGKLTLQLDGIFDYFQKNYLAAVDDANGNGNITRSERIYRAATYDEYQARLSYRHTLLKDKHAALSNLALIPMAGYERRVYNSAFENRDRKTGMLGLGCDLGFFSRLDVELFYRYEQVGCPGDAELVLYDETVANLDVNHDGEITGNAALYTAIDRSCSRSTLGINPSFKLTKNARVFFEYERRITDYDSDNPLDIDHYDQNVLRNKLTSGIKYKFMKSWAAQASYTWCDEDAKADEENYTQNSYQFSLRYQF